MGILTYSPVISVLAEVDPVDIESRPGQRAHARAQVLAARTSRAPPVCRAPRACGSSWRCARTRAAAQAFTCDVGDLSAGRPGPVAAREQRLAADKRTRWRG
ncbi:MAG: hypothetical protein M3O70_15635, partial [Actinomycetota bacterium]|nr:hypothetical protein [Actinomycetota bacterium]